MKSRTSAYVCLVVCLAMLVSLCVMGGCKGRSGADDSSGGDAAKAPGSLAGAPSDVPAFKGDPSAVPASGMKADRVQQRQRPPGI